MSDNTEFTERLADTANRAAVFHSMRTEDERPGITVAGVQVTVYIDPAGQLRVGIDLEDAEVWLTRADGHRTVGLEVCVQGEIVFET